MKTIIESAVIALMVSAVYGKISAAHTFKVIDSYVKDMIETAKKLIRDTQL